MNTASIPSPLLSNFKLLAQLALATVWMNMPNRVDAQEGVDRERGGPPTLTVTGRGEVLSAPDSATLRLGAVAEDKEAVTAQSRVNEVMQRAVKAVQALRIPENKITTVGLSLSPIYEQPERPLNVARPARISGYRARNTLQIQLQDLQLIGKAIDAGVAAGANQIEGISFQLKDDARSRRDALTLAIEEARAKADAIAQAMRLRIRGVREVIEGGVHTVPPRMEFAATRMAMAADVSTPVQPGEVRVEANVTVRFYLEEPRPDNR